MPILLAAIILAGVFYWTVPVPQQREVVLKPIRHTLMASVGLIDR